MSKSKLHKYPLASHADSGFAQPQCCSNHRDLTAAEVSDGGQNIRPRSAGRRRSAAADTNSSASDSDAEAIEAHDVSEAMADAYAQRAPAEQAVPSGEQQQDAAVAAAEPSVGVSEMERVEAEAGQTFRYPF